MNSPCRLYILVRFSTLFLQRFFMYSYNDYNSYSYNSYNDSY